jgi:NAD+ diphosphatase
VTVEPLPGLALARSVVDRAAHRRLDDAWLAEAWAAESTRVLRLAGSRLLVTGDPPRPSLDSRPDVGTERRFFLGTDASGTAYFAVADPDDSAATPDVDGGRYLGLRAVGALLPDLEAGLVVHATSLANWHATHTHCPRCGSPTRPEAGGHLRRCDRDGSEHYPRTDPAVIMAVVDDRDRLLLGRQATWDEGRFSTLAGFVEPGESLEAAVRREVAEEVGIRVGAVRYLASQPWPFPSSLMLGFTADAETVHITRHDGEIAEARWYDRPGLAADIAAGRVHVAPSISISRRLIEHWNGGPLPLNADS